MPVIRLVVASTRSLNVGPFSGGGKLTAVLRASGPEFDVDAFVADCPWRIAKVFRRGESLLPKARPDGRRCEEAGLNVVVSEAGFDALAEQVQDAAAFLTESAAEVRRLVGFAGATGVELDFGVAWRDVVAQSDQFPAGLVRLAGACGIALAFSHYHVSNDQVPAGEPAAGAGGVSG